MGEAPDTDAAGHLHNAMPVAGNKSDSPLNGRARSTHQSTHRCADPVFTIRSMALKCRINRSRHIEEDPAKNTKRRRPREDVHAKKTGNLVGGARKTYGDSHDLQTTETAGDGWAVFNGRSRFSDILGRFQRKGCLLRK